MARSVFSGAICGLAAMSVASVIVWLAACFAHLGIVPFPMPLVRAYGLIGILGGSVAGVLWNVGKESS